MALTLIEQEFFDPTLNGGLTVYNNNNTGSFSYFTGSMKLKPVGAVSPNTASGLPGFGYSATPTQYGLDSITSGYNAYGVYNLTSSALVGGVMSGWYHISSINANNPFLFQFTRNFNNQFFDPWFVFDIFMGGLRGRILPLNFFYLTQSIPSLIDQWVWLCAAWEQTSSAQQSGRVVLFGRYATQPTASVLFYHPSASMSNSSGNNYRALYGFYGLMATDNIIGRVGAVQIYSKDINNFADSASIPYFTASIYDPPAQPYTWYINPTNGNDSNTGLSSITAWQTAGKINVETGNTEHGVFGTPFTRSFDIPGQGDRILFDTTLAPLTISSSYSQSIHPHRNGLYFGPTTPGNMVYINAWKVIPSSSWQPVSGTLKTFSTTDDGTNVDYCYVWENDKWMNTWWTSSYNVISQSMDLTAGSFFEISGTIYLHPFGDTDPRSDGKTYIRSQPLYNPSLTGTGDNVINLSNYGMSVNNFYITKSATKNPNDTNPPGSYCLGFQGGGASLISNCYFSYGGKHVTGITTNNDGCNVIFSNVQAEQCMPGPHGPNTFIVFSGFPGSFGSSKVTLLNCTSSNSAGVIGSTMGSNQGNSIYSHNNGGQQQFASFVVQNSNLIGGGIMQAISSVFTMSNTSCTTFDSYYTASVDKCFINGLIYTENPSNVTIKNSVIYLTNLFTVSSLYLRGPVTISNCTVDTRNYLSAGTTRAALFGTDIPASSSIYFYNNILMLNQDYTVFGNFSNGSINSDYNAYLLFSPNNYLGSASLGSGSSFQSFTNYQTNGLELHSNVYPQFSALNINSLYVPQAGSPLINAGINLGYLYDLTGQIFSSRLTIGAYEFLAVILELIKRQAGPAPNQAQTVNNAIKLQPQTANDFVLKERQIFTDPYLLTLMEELDYLRARGVLTRNKEMVLLDEIAGRICFLRS